MDTDLEAHAVAEYERGIRERDFSEEIGDYALGSYWQGYVDAVSGFLDVLGVDDE